MKHYPTHCIDCDGGTYDLLIVDFTERDLNGAEVTVPGVEVLRCSNCGEELIPAASSKKISKAVAEANEQLKPDQLYAMFERFDVEQQKELAEICGFGEKTFGRWLKGTQVVSRSMGYYLRVLDRFPEAFAYIRERKWRMEEQLQEIPAEGGTPLASDDTVIPFPALRSRNALPGHSGQNAASIFECVEA